MRRASRRRGASRPPSRGRECPRSRSRPTPRASRFGLTDRAPVGDFIAEWRHDGAMKRVRAIAFLLGAGCAAAATSFACGDLGEPAFAGDDGGVAPPEFFDAIATDAAEAEASPALVPLTGAVRDPDTDAGLPFAVVAIEMGGLDQTNPGNLGADGGIVPTLTINPFYRYGTLTDDAGAFSLDVPSERVGVHV